MANRFPLVLDTTDGNKIKELPADDNLDLRENSIVNVQNINALGTINAPEITVNGQRLVAQNFRDLTDTPNTFVGAENYFVKVNETGSGIEFRPLDDIGNINVSTITASGSILPTVAGVGNVGTNAAKFNQIVANELVGDLVSYSGTTVFDATTGKVSYAALQGAPGFLSEFQDDIGFLRAADLNSELAGLFDEGIPFESDIKGSVFADDSTILVDGVSGIIRAPVITTTVNAGQITGDALITSPILDTALLRGSAGADVKIEAVQNYNVIVGESNTNSVKIYNGQAQNFGLGLDLGVGTINGATDLIINAENRIKIGSATPFKLSMVTGSERDTIIAQNGDVIYNTTVNRFQMFQNNSWLDFNGNVQAASGQSDFNDVVIAGNLTVSGTTTSVETTNTTITDNTIVINNGEGGAGVTLGTAGISIDRGSLNDVQIIWNETTDKFIFRDEAAARLNVEALTFIGNLDGDVTGDITGDVKAANGSTVLDSGTNGTDATFTGDVTGNVTGNVTGYHTGDMTGSVFADDSSPMVDAVGNALNASTATIAETTSPLILSTNINPILNGLINVGGAAGGLSYNGASGATALVSTGGVKVEGAALAPVEIGTGTTGSITLGNGTNNIVVTAGTTVDLASVTVSNAAFDLTGNIDNTTLNVGATATTVNVGNATSTTNLLGNVTFDTALIVANITADDSISILTEGNSPNEAISLGPQGTNTAINLTADNLRFNGSVTTTINATGGVEGDLKGSVYADDSSVMIDGVNAQVVGNVSSNLVRTPEIKNLANGTDVDIEAQGFLELFGGAANAGLSKIQLDTAGINYIELQTVPNTPGDVNDTATILINGQTNSGNVVIGNSATTRNQTVEIYNATVTGDVIGTVTGTFNGIVTGDVNGSIYADDSTLLVDGVNGTIPWSVITGFTGGGQEEYDVFATSLSAASSANVTAGSYFRNEADTADIAVSASVTSGFSKMKVMLSANIHNPINTSTEAVVRLERSVNGGAGTTVKRFIFPAGSNYYGGVEFMFVDDHGQVPGSLIEYKLVNDMSNGYSGEDLRMWYGISGDTFGLKEIV